LPQQYRNFRQYPGETARGILTALASLPGQRGFGVIHSVPSRRSAANRRIQEIGRLELLVSELQHRARNLFSVVRLVAQRTARDHDSLAEFVPAFEARLLALARAQSLLTPDQVHGRVYLSELLTVELSSLGGARSGGLDARIRLEGTTDVPLEAGTVEVLALALHELATNAAKYGVLSQSGGTLVVAWRIVPEQDSPWLRIEWTERSPAAPLRAPALTGFGRELIERALPRQFGARTAYSVGEGGVHCTIELPYPKSGR
jgi:two-component sensor histidine kinase